MTDENSGTEQDRNDSDREQELYTAYFYYLDYSGSEPVIRAYEYFDNNTPITNLDQLAETLAEDAIDNTDPDGSDFDDFHRERKGYVIIALEGAKFAAEDPLVFRCDRAKFKSSKNNNGKHTFKPVSQFDRSVSGRDVSFVVYRYTAKNYRSGRELEQHEWEHYNLSFEAELPSGLRAGLYDGSGGTNMGPPPPPPARRLGRQADDEAAD